MDKKETSKSNNVEAQKKQNTRGGNAKGTNATPSNSTNSYCSNNGVNSVKSISRSKSTLSVNKNYTPSRLRNLNRHITMERNGSMPNLNATGPRTQVDKITKLKFSYDKYLSSLVAKCVFQDIQKKIMSNIDAQKKVFRDEFYNLKTQLLALREELDSINKLKIKKKTLDENIEVLEMLNKAIIFDGTDEEIMSLFANTTSKVVVKNFKKLDENDLNSVKVLLSEIIEPLKLIDYSNKINARVQLKDLIIKVATLTKELDKCKFKCEELFEKQESLENENKSLKIMKAQFAKNPDTKLLPHKNALKDDVEKILDNIEW